MYFVSEPEELSAFWKKKTLATGSYSEPDEFSGQISTAFCHMSFNIRSSARNTFDLD
jgi:hypothetical protein